MLSSTVQNLVYDIKISSVGPSRVTGTDVVHELNGIDLAMKLHYLHALYFFGSQAAQGLTVMQIKESLFHWCNDYYVTSGRFRRSDTGRPYVKCNDCGVRMIEAQCSKTVDEWLQMKDCSLNKLLVYHLPIGPEISFSPSCYIQFTDFKCGGMSVGLSWAHILGDPFSASECINTWGLFLSGLKSNGPLQIMKKSPERPEKSENVRAAVLALKRVEPVGDLWVTANNCKMETFSGYLTAVQISHLLSNIWGQSSVEEVPLFESLCATMWQCIAKVRDGHEPRRVTVCKKDPDYPESGILSNGQIISTVETDSPVADSNLRKLAILLGDRATDKKKQIGEIVEKDNGVLDYIVYGANLTFLNLEEANIYGLEWKGNKPIFVHYSIQGVGDEGAVIVLPWPEDDGKRGDTGRVVTVILPEKEMIELKSELKEKGLLLDSELE